MQREAMDVIQPDFDNRYARLSERFFARVVPARAPAPRLIALNQELAAEMRLDPEQLASQDGKIFSPAAASRRARNPSRPPMRGTSQPVVAKHSHGILRSKLFLVKDNAGKGPLFDGLRRCAAQAGSAKEEPPGDVAED
jgi:hypothetical protein